MSFSDLGLKPELLRAVGDKGYTVATPIQSQAIPAVLAGRDVLAGAQTGTGKTAAFVLPLLQRLGTRAQRGPRVLVLSPTRELAAQIAASAQEYGKYSDLRTEVVFGGVNINPQIDKLRRGCDLLVATPGRLLDLAEQRALSFQHVESFVLDEADRMLDMGFIRDIKRLIKLLPPVRQNLLFSATYSEDIRNLASGLLRDPAQIAVAPRNSTADKVEQRAYRVSKEHKRHLLAHLINDGNWHQVLVFTRTKHGANRLAQQLERAGIKTAAIHGNKSQNARVRALEDFKQNRIIALVATEVAARGLDIKELPFVVNYELPNVPEDYVHRIGRTARAGSTGCAVSLVSPDEAPLLRDIEKLLKRQVEFAAAPQFSVQEAPAHAPRAAAAAPEPRAERSSTQDARAGSGHSSPRHRRPQQSTDRRATPAPERSPYHGARPKASPGHAHGRSAPGDGRRRDTPRSNSQRRDVPRRDNAARGGRFGNGRGGFSRLG
jgi:ATP-dependent RNA helicase RhlE